MAAKKKQTTRTDGGKRAAPRRYAPAEPAMQKMLDAAEEVLIRDGYHAFSTRRVAAECGVSLGHLTYYFPTKIKLLRAMISSVMARYAEKIRIDSAAAEMRSDTDLREMLAWFFRDTVTKETSGLMRELWVLAKHDAVVAREVLQFYEGLMASLVEVVTPFYPAADPRHLAQIAHLVGMLTEGGTVLFAGPGERAVSYEEMLPLAIDVVLRELELAAGSAAVTPPRLKVARAGGRKTG